jgi:hydrolethalus syndrome protein 1
MIPFGEEEVLKHLEDLGYKNISQEQLSEFVKDLKKLLRYEEKQKRRNEQIGVTSKIQQESGATTASSFSSNGTVPSKISNSSSRFESDLQPEQPKLARRRKRKSRERELEVSEVSSTHSSAEESEMLLRINIENDNGDQTDSKMSNPNAKFASRPTTSVIRAPRKATLAKDLRSDPVQMHQFYQRIWQRTHFPGDDSSKDMRWAVREWMLGHRE